MNPLGRRHMWTAPLAFFSVVLVWHFSKVIHSVQSLNGFSWFSRSVAKKDYFYDGTPVYQKQSLIHKKIAVQRITYWYAWCCVWSVQPADQISIILCSCRYISVWGSENFCCALCSHFKVQTATWTPGQRLNYDQCGFRQSREVRDILEEESLRSNEL